jgi:pilus assembly protein CpaF
VASNALARLRQEREAQAVTTGPAPEPRERPKFIGLQADQETSPEQEAVRRIIARLGDEGQGLTDGDQRALAKALVGAEAGDLSRAQVEAIEREVLMSLGGRLGLLQPLMDDPDVTEIMVNRPDQVFVERAGTVELTDIRFRDDRSVQALVERVVGPLGRGFSLAHPTVDARLPDGSRVNAVRPPISLLGTTLTIRRFPRAFTLRELVEVGAFGEGRAWSLPADLDGPYPEGAPPWAVLAWAVHNGANLIVSGGTGSGKTTVLNAVTEFIPRAERVVFIEDAAELQPRLPHVIRLESRPANTEGEGAVPIQHLVVNALRMRPDRIVVGEVRDIESLDMLVAMNTGHDGSLTTVHSNSPAEVFDRLVQATTLRSTGGAAANERTIVKIAANALKIIVQVVRHRGRRRFDSITAVEGVDGSGEPRLRELFRWDGRVLAPTGERPGWLQPDGTLRI